MGPVAASMAAWRLTPLSALELAAVVAGWPGLIPCEISKALLVPTVCQEWEYDQHPVEPDSGLPRRPNLVDHKFADRGPSR